MNAKITISCFLVLFFVFPVMAKEIPGGIVYSNDEKIIYYDFKTGKETNLVSDLNFKGPKIAAISPDGELLVWLGKDDRFWARILPDEKPFLLLMRETKKPGGSARPIEAGLSFAKKPVKNLSISADKHFFAYETLRKGLVKANILKKGLENKVRSILKSDHSLAKKTQMLEEIGAVDNIKYLITRHIIREERGGRICDLYGDTRWWGARLKPNGYFHTWSKKGEISACITLKDIEEWGPVEIRDWKKSLMDPNSFQRVYKKIKIDSANCQGLAWKPDNTITYLSEGTLYSEDNQVIAQGIKASRLYWLSNNSFIFRGQDKSLYFWEKGKQEKFLNSIPEEFSYSSRSPSTVINLAKALAKAPARVNKESVKVPVKTNKVPAKPDKVLAKSPTKVPPKIEKAIHNTLALGRNYETNGMLALAQKKYQETINRYPDAPGIEKVKEHLQALEDRLKK